MCTETGQYFLKCLWVNPLKQLKHGLALAICKMKHSTCSLDVKNALTLPHAFLASQPHASCFILHIALMAIL